LFTREFLSSIRLIALRKKIWFSALDSIERGILSISAQLISCVKSRLLEAHLEAIVNKIKNAGKSNFTLYCEQKKLEKISQFNQNVSQLGIYREIIHKVDCQFVRYLMFLDYNQPKGWRLN
jgi:hypothetical protein